MIIIFYVVNNMTEEKTFYKAAGNAEIIYPIL